MTMVCGEEAAAAADGRFGGSLQHEEEMGIMRRCSMGGNSGSELGLTERWWRRLEDRS
jgi:hypothetical protein